MNTTSPDDTLDRWLAAASERYLADLTMPELTRALRALSSCYVERRSKLASGQALASAGKRAAFALFYAPLHFITIDRIARELLRSHDNEASGGSRPSRITLDLGCGTGAAGAAWALATGASRVSSASSFRTNAAITSAGPFCQRTLSIGTRCVDPGRPIAL